MFDLTLVQARDPWIYIYTPAVFPMYFHQSLHCNNICCLKESTRAITCTCVDAFMDAIFAKGLAHDQN